jgi:hypothetical protein
MTGMFGRVRRLRAEIEAVPPDGVVAYLTKLTQGVDYDELRLTVGQRQTTSAVKLAGAYYTNQSAAPVRVEGILSGRVVSSTPINPKFTAEVRRMVERYNLWRVQRQAV